MSPKPVDPADEKYAAPKAAGPDPEAEEQEDARALAVTHGENPPLPPAPPAKGEGYPAGEAKPGYHDGPPARINCERCGHAHQVRSASKPCERCGMKLPSLEQAKKDAVAV